MWSTYKFIHYLFIYLKFCILLGKQYLPAAQVWNADIFSKKTRQIRKNDKKYFIQSMLHRLIYIFSIFRAICEYHASKSLPLLLRIVH